MKFHKELTSKDTYIESDIIYDADKASISKLDHIQLSFMKQENIRVTLLDKKIDLKLIKHAGTRKCGFCLEYMDRGRSSCEQCPLNKEGKDCTELLEYKKMKRARTKNGFSKAHKNWCIELRLWKETFK